MFSAVYEKTILVVKERICVNRVETSGIDNEMQLWKAR